MNRTRRTRRQQPRTSRNSRGGDVRVKITAAFWTLEEHKLKCFTTTLSFARSSGGVEERKNKRK